MLTKSNIHFDETILKESIKAGLDEYESNQLTALSQSVDLARAEIEALLGALKFGNVFSGLIKPDHEHVMIDGRPHKVVSMIGTAEQLMIKLFQHKEESLLFLKTIEFVELSHNPRTFEREIRLKISFVSVLNLNTCIWAGE